MSDNTKQPVIGTEEEQEKIESLELICLEAICEMINDISVEIPRSNSEAVERYSRAVKNLAEAYATIEKAGKEVNAYEIIKGVCGTGIKGSQDE